MRQDLEYPFDPEYILKKSKHIKKELLADGSARSGVVKLPPFGSEILKK